MKVTSLHFVRTYKRLPDHVRCYIRDDWYQVLEFAERLRSLRRGDGLVDGCVPDSLKKLHIDERSVDEYRAYHYMLFNHFLFLFDECGKVKSAERRRAETGGGHASKR